MLHAHLQSIQHLLDTLQGTNVYAREIKRDANALQRSLAPHLKKWFEYHLETSEARQVDYLELSTDLDNALDAVMNCHPALLKAVPNVLNEILNYVQSNNSNE